MLKAIKAFFRPLPADWRERMKANRPYVEKPEFDWRNSPMRWPFTKYPGDNTYLVWVKSNSEVGKLPPILEQHREYLQALVDSTPLYAGQSYKVKIKVRQFAPFDAKVMILDYNDHTTLTDA